MIIAAIAMPAARSTSCAARGEVRLAAGKRLCEVKFGEARGAYIFADLRGAQPAHDASGWQAVRTSWLLANHKAVVSECEPDTEIDDDVRAAIVAVPYGELVKSCVALVKDDARRREVEQRGFEIFARRDQAAMLAAVLARVSRPVPRRINLGSGKAQGGMAAGRLARYPGRCRSGRKCQRGDAAALTRPRAPGSRGAD